MSELTPFASEKPTGIFMPPMPYSVRNDCQLGQWKVSDSDLRGNSIDISIIKVTQMFGSLGKTENETWLQLWFVPAPGEEKLPKNTVCVTYLKTRSITQFMQRAIELLAMGGEDKIAIFTGSFEKHSGELGTYYSVTWNYRHIEAGAETEQAELISAFLKSEPQLIDTRTTQNMINIDGLSAAEIRLLVESTKQGDNHHESRNQDEALVQNQGNQGRAAGRQTASRKR